MMCASPERWPATDLSLIGDLLRRLEAPVRDNLDDREVLDESTSAAPAGSIRVERLLNRAEAEAVSAFRRAGLPDVPGVYHRGAGETEWVLTPSISTPEDRFAYVLAHSDGGGRHAGLAQIGRLERPEDPIVALASDLLGQVSDARERLTRGSASSSGHELEAAFELTMTWMRLCELTAAPAPRTRKSAAAARLKTPSRSRRAVSRTRGDDA